LPNPPSVLAVFLLWQDVQLGAQLERDQNRLVSPLCGMTWSTVVAAAPQAQVG
jgi:hypothetical protein